MTWFSPRMNSIDQFSPGSLFFPILLLQTCRILKDYTLSWSFSLPDLRRQLGAALCLCLRVYSMGPVVRENDRAICNDTDLEIARWRFHVYQLADHSWLSFSSKGPPSFLEYISIRQCVLSLGFNLTALLSKSMVSVIAFFLDLKLITKWWSLFFFFLAKFVICAFTNCMTPPCRTQFGTSLSRESSSDVTFSDTRSARSFLFGFSPFRTRSNALL